MIGITNAAKLCQLLHEFIGRKSRAMSFISLLIVCGALLVLEIANTWYIFKVRREFKKIDDALADSFKQRKCEALTLNN